MTQLYLEVDIIVILLQMLTSANRVHVISYMESALIRSDPSAVRALEVSPLLEMERPAEVNV